MLSDLGVALHSESANISSVSSRMFARSSAETLYTSIYPLGVRIATCLASKDFDFSELCSPALRSDDDNPSY